MFLQAKNSVWWIKPPLIFSSLLKAKRKTLPAGIHERLSPARVRWCHILTPGKIQKTSCQTSARSLPHQLLQNKTKSLIKSGKCLLKLHLYPTSNYIYFISRDLKSCCYLLRTLLAAATRSYVLPSSYMILTRNWPSISSWASLLKTKGSCYSQATANVTAEVNSLVGNLFRKPLALAFLQLLFCLHQQLDTNGWVFFHDIYSAGNIKKKLLILLWSPCVNCTAEQAEIANQV